MDIIIPQTPGIYKIFFLGPNLFYIGQTVRSRKRFQSHLQELRKGIHGNSHMQHAYDKYGPDAFHFEIVEYVESKENLTEREQYYMDLLKPYYNICPIANTPPPWSPEMRQKVSQANKGRQFSAETRAKMSAAKRGKTGVRKGAVLTEEQRAKMSISHKGQTPHNKGKPRSEETKAKISRSLTGKPGPHKGKRFSEEHKRKLSETHAGKTAWNKGKPHSPETRAKMSAAKRGKTPWNKGKKTSSSIIVEKQSIRQLSLWDSEPAS